MRWIDVTKQAPADGQVVLVHYEGGAMLTREYEDDGTGALCHEFPECRITHWMPLPPLPAPER